MAKSCPSLANSCPECGAAAIACGFAADIVEISSRLAKKRTY